MATLDEVLAEGLDWMDKFIRKFYVTNVPGGDTTPPSTCLAPVGSLDGSNQPIFTWPAATDNVGVDHYLISVNNAADVVLGNVLTYTITGASNGTYSVRVKAVDGAGNQSVDYSPVSNIVTVSTPVGDTTAPPPPLGLAITLDANNHPVLTWFASNDPDPSRTVSTDRTGLKDYRIYRDGVVLGSPVNAPGSGFVDSLTPVDIGVPAVAGSTVQTAATLQLTAGGVDFYGTADQGHAASVQMTGDFTRSFKLTSMAATQQFAKVGMFARTSMDPGSAHVAIAFCPPTLGGGYQVNTRAATNGATTVPFSNVSVYTLPLYARMQRVGDVFTLSVSADGKTFTAMGSVSIALGATVYTGYFGSAHAATGTMVATLEECMATTQPSLSYTDATTTIGNSYTYAVSARDIQLNESTRLPASSITIGSSPPLQTTFGIKKGAGGTTISTLDGSQIKLIGSAMIGTEESQQWAAGAGGRIAGVAAVTTAQYTAAIQKWYDAASTAAKPYCLVNMIRIPLNSAMWMGFTGLAPFGNGSLNGIYPSVGTDSNGRTIYSGALHGWGLGTVGHEVAGVPTEYRNLIKQEVARALAAGLYVMLDLHWSTPTLVATGQYILPIGQAALPGPGDVLFWTDIANTFGTQNGTTGSPAIMFETFNEPFGTGSATNFAAEQTYLANQILNRTTQIAYPVASEPSGPNGGYRMKNNNGGDVNTLISLPNGPSGYPQCYAVGQQALINAIRATGATNMIWAGGPNYSGEPGYWLTMGLTDSANNLGCSYHAYGYKGGMTPFYNLQAAGYPVLATEIGHFDAIPSSYVEWRTRGFGYTFWGWNNWGAGPNMYNTSMNVIPPWSGNGQIAPTGSN